MTATAPAVDHDAIAAALLDSRADGTHRVDMDTTACLAALVASGALGRTLEPACDAVASGWVSDRALQQAPKLPAGTLTGLASDDRPHRRAVAAGARTLTAATARRLSDDADVAVRQAVAGNVRAPTDVLSARAADGRKEVRQAAVLNPATPVVDVAARLHDRASDVTVAARSALLRRAAGGDGDAARALLGEKVRDLVSSFDGNPNTARAVPHRLEVLAAVSLLGGDVAKATSQVMRYTRDGDPTLGDLVA